MDESRTEYVDIAPENMTKNEREMMQLVEHMLFKWDRDYSSLLANLAAAGHSAKDIGENTPITIMNAAMHIVLMPYIISMSMHKTSGGKEMMAAFVRDLVSGCIESISTLRNNPDAAIDRILAAHEAAKK